MRGRAAYFLCLLLWAVSAAAPPSSANAQEAQAAVPLTVEEVLRLSQNGFSEELIITRIKKNARAFDLNSDELVALRKAGLSETIIRYLLDPALPYTVPPPPGAAPAGSPPPPAAKPKQARKYPADPHASRVPPDAGLYSFPTAVALSVDLKLLLGMVEGPGIGKVFMKKGKTVIYLAGPAAKARFDRPDPVFYLRLPEDRKIEEVVLIEFNRKDNRREIELGPKQELRADAILPFDSVEVAAGVFRLAPTKLRKGEYLLFFVGSPDPSKGTFGKGYDFAIDEIRR